VTLSAGHSAAADEQTPAEKLRAALDRPHEVEIANRPLPEAVRLLSEQTGLTFVLDPSVTAEIEQKAALAVPSALPANFVGPPAPGAPAPGVSPTAPPVLEMYAADAPLRTALRKALEPLALSAVVIGDRVVIARPAVALQRQLGQPVTVDLDKRELGDVLRDLRRQTGANVLLDPKAAKEARTPLTLRLVETPLESAVAVLADAAGLRSVRLGNVLYVTSDSRAEVLRAERDAQASTARRPQRK
jgi:type II secretory pathway component GspD/PulD (secretin)